MDICLNIQKISVTLGIRSVFNEKENNNDIRLIVKLINFLVSCASMYKLLMGCHYLQPFM